jgi:hypothetical protein
MDDAHDVVAAYWAAAEARDFWPTPYELPASRADLVERY